MRALTFLGANLAALLAGVWVATGDTAYGYLALLCAFMMAVGAAAPWFTRHEPAHADLLLEADDLPNLWQLLPGVLSWSRYDAGVGWYSKIQALDFESREVVVDITAPLTEDYQRARRAGEIDPLRGAALLEFALDGLEQVGFELDRDEIACTATPTDVINCRGRFLATYIVAVD